jgi:hypothetical protein
MLSTVNCRDIYDAKRPRPVNTLALLIYITEYIVILFTESEFMLCNMEQHKVDVGEY